MWSFYFWHHYSSFFSCGEGGDDEVQNSARSSILGEGQAVRSTNLRSSALPTKRHPQMKCDQFSQEITP